MQRLNPCHFFSRIGEQVAICLLRHAKSQFLGRVTVFGEARLERSFLLGLSMLSTIRILPL